MDNVSRQTFNEVMVPNYQPADLIPVRGAGSRFWDQQNREYVDFAGGIAVTSLGHCHPKLVAALNAQAQKLWHLSNVMTNEPALRLAKKLCEATFAERVFFCNSGAEANEAAFKVARKFGGRGRHVVVSAFGSFHGRTLAALAATGQPTKHEPFQPMPEGFRHVPYGDLDALAAAIDPSVTAVLIEPVQGEGGVVPAPPGYLEGIRALCDERGLLMIVDEVQTGFARTGRWFGFDHADVRPDVVCLAKAMGNGMPIGACWARREVAAVLQPGDHGSTYSGTPIATAAARATIAELRRIDAPALARLAGARLQRLLLSTPGVTDVRGAGLLLAAELDGRDTKPVAAACLERGLVVNNVTPTALRFAPPLTVSDDEIDEAVAIVKEVLA